MLRISGFDIRFKTEQDRQKNIFIVFSIFSQVAVLAFALFYLFTGKSLAFGVLIAYFIVNLANTLFYFFFRKLSLATEINMLSVFFVLFSSIVTFSAGIDFVFWFFLFPIYAIIMGGSSRGNYYAIAFLFVSIYLLGFDTAFSRLHFTWSTLLRYTFVYLTILAMVNFFEFTRKKTHESLLKIYERAKEKEKKMAELYHEIKVQNEEMKATEEILSKNNMELRKLNRKLEQRETWLSNLIEYHGEGFAVTDWKNTFIFANPAAHELFGVEDGTLIGRNLSEFIDKEQFERVEQYTKVRKKGVKNTYEMLIKRPDGSTKNVLVTGAPFVWQDKRILGTVGVFRDITERKKQEQELEASRRWLMTILEAIPVAILMVDLETGTINFVNSYTERMLGYGKEQIQGKLCKDVLCQGAEQCAFCMENLSNQYSKEGYINTKAGNSIAVYRTVSRIFYQEKHYLIISFVDITKLKKVERLLKEKNRQFRNTIENLIDVYVRADLQGNIVQASPSAVKELGVRSLSEIIGHNLADFFRMSRHKKFQFFSALIRQGEISRFRFSYTRQGTRRYLEVNAILVRDREGNPAGFEAIVRNITSIIVFEQKLRSLNKKLHKAFKTLKQQKDLLEATHKSLVESMEYAKLIQKGLMPDSYLLNYLFDDYFVLFMPKAAVGGDFYFAKQIKNKIYVAVADSTGHGVPGGFLSMIGISFLNEALNEQSVESPAEILEYMRLKIKALMGNFNKGEASKNGMELALCEIDENTAKLVFAGANLPAYIVRNKTIFKLSPTKNPIGFHYIETEFEERIFQLQKDDVLYLFSDGYADQLSENKGKFKRGKFKELLLSVSEKSMSEQKAVLLETLMTWRGKEEQTDDITVMGIRF